MLKIRGQDIPFTFVKGLEGSCEIRLAQTTIVAVSKANVPEGFEYLKLHPQDYGFLQAEAPLLSPENLFSQINRVLQGDFCELTPPVLWNGGFYLWRAGLCPDLATGIAKAKDLLNNGLVAQKKDEVYQLINEMEQGVPILSETE